MEGMNIAVTPAIQKICHSEDIQSSLQTEAKSKFIAFGFLGHLGGLTTLFPIQMSG
jgi:hypothetical protein